MAQRTKAWHAQRRGRITSSRVDDLIGESKYGSLTKLAQNMRGEGTFHGNDAADWGTHAEAYVHNETRRRWKDRVGPHVDVVDTGLWLVPSETLASETAVDDVTRASSAFAAFVEAQPIGASPDGLVTSDVDGRPGVAEFKAPASMVGVAPRLRHAKMIHYAAQVFWHMLATGRRTYALFTTMTPQHVSVEYVPWPTRVSKRRCVEEHVTSSDVAPWITQGWVTDNGPNAATYACPGLAGMVFRYVFEFWTAFHADDGPSNDTEWDAWFFTGSVTVRRFVRAALKTMADETVDVFRGRPTVAPVPVPRYMPTSQRGFCGWPALAAWQGTLFEAWHTSTIPPNLQLQRWGAFRRHGNGTVEPLSVDTLYATYGLDPWSHRAGPGNNDVARITLTLFTGRKRNGFPKKIASFDMVPGTRQPVPYWTFGGAAQRCPATGWFMAVYRDARSARVHGPTVGPWNHGTDGVDVVVDDTVRVRFRLDDLNTHRTATVTVTRGSFDGDHGNDGGGTDDSDGTDGTDDNGGTARGDERAAKRRRRSSSESRGD